MQSKKLSIVQKLFISHASEVLLKLQDAKLVDL